MSCCRKSNEQGSCLETLDDARWASSRDFGDRCLSSSSSTHVDCSSEKRASPHNRTVRKRSNDVATGECEIPRAVVAVTAEGSLR